MSRMEHDIAKRDSDKRVNEMKKTAEGRRALKQLGMLPPPSKSVTKPGAGKREGMRRKFALRCACPSPRERKIPMRCACPSPRERKIPMRPRLNEELSGFPLPSPVPPYQVE
jgi:hypothetical protein